MDIGQDQSVGPGSTGPVSRREMALHQAGDLKPQTGSQQAVCKITGYFRETNLETEGELPLQNCSGNSEMYTVMQMSIVILDALTDNQP